MCSLTAPELSTKALAVSWPPDCSLKVWRVSSQSVTRRHGVFSEQLRAFRRLREYADRPKALPEGLAGILILQEF
jgi:hypothetical protein